VGYKLTLTKHTGMKKIASIMMAMAFLFSVSAMAATPAPAKKEVKKECSKTCKKGDKSCCKKDDKAPTKK
jgi:hypothetical protein